MPRTFTFNVYCDMEYSEHPEKVDIALTQADINRIKTAHSVLEDNEYDTVELSLGDIEYYDLDDNGNKIPDDDLYWRVEMERVRIRSSGWSVISFDKYNGWIYWTDYLPIHIL